MRPCPKGLKSINAKPKKWCPAAFIIELLAELPSVARADLKRFSQAVFFAKKIMDAEECVDDILQI